VQTITGTWIGTRFINVDFQADSDTTVMMTLPTAAAGIEFYNCRWLPGTATTTGLNATGVTALKLSGCSFEGWWDSGFSTACIELENGTAHGQIIENCTFHNQCATGPALLANSGSTGIGCFFRNNIIMNEAIAIDDNSDGFVCIGNRIVTAVAKAAETSVDIVVAHAVDNIVTGSDGSVRIPSITDIST
jgi:hypothetical protein